MTATKPAQAADPIAGLVARLSGRQKALLVNGADTWTTVPFAEIGLGTIRMSDGPTGVRGTAWDERHTAVSFPCGVALGATFDPALLGEVGRALAAEAKAQDVHVVLGPTINLQRFPNAGRHFEYLSADPYLSSLLAVAYVRGLQGDGVAASPKHFVANDSETDRHTVSVEMDEAVLRETYLLPFEAVVRDAGAWTLMAAYSSIDGVAMTANDRLLGDIAIGEWGFDGVMLSDWGAVYDTESTVHAALHLAMPGPGGAWGAPLRDAVHSGAIEATLLDDKVRRILVLAARTGVLRDLASTPAPAPPLPAAPEPAAVARRAAEASMVLLANDALLPIDPSSVAHVAVIGPNAVHPSTQGGGSAHVNAGTIVTPAAAIAERLCPTVQVTMARGCAHRIRVPELGVEMSCIDPATGAPGLGLAYLDAGGEILWRETRRTGSFVWYGELPGGIDPSDVALVRITADVDVAAPGEFEIGLDGMTDQRLLVDRSLAISVERSSDDDAESFHRPDERRTIIDVAAPRRVSLVIEQDLHDDRGMGRCQIGMRPRSPSEDDLIAEAVAAAATADVAVVVVGTNPEVESEGFDRTSLALPGRQDELIRRVCAANPATVVVINAGAPVLTPWRDDVAALVVSWFGGQWSGPALAGVLFGDVEPTGRLPMPWPDADDGLEPTRPDRGVLRYDRHPPLDPPGHAFAFGAGLGYTKWEFTSASLTAGSADADADADTDAWCRFGDQRSVGVEVELVNRSDRTGTTTVQVYAGDEARSVYRLVGVAKATGHAGERTKVHVDVPARLLHRWDAASAGWVPDQRIEHLVVAADARASGIVVDARSVVADLAAAVDPLQPAEPEGAGT